MMAIAPNPDPGSAGVAGMDVSFAFSAFQQHQLSVAERQTSSKTDFDELVAANLELVKKKKMSAPEMGQYAEKIMALGKDGNPNFAARMQLLLSKHGIERPMVTVEYEISVEADAKAVTRGLLGKEDKKKTVLPILRNVKGVLRPGRMTLLLGPPGAGKSTMLKALAGRLKPCSTLRAKSDVKYNGHTFDEFVVEKTAAFIDQLDVHIAALTVAETLRFAFNCQIGFDTKHLFNPVYEAMKARSRRKGSPLTDTDATAGGNTVQNANGRNGQTEAANSAGDQELQVMGDGEEAEDAEDPADPVVEEFEELVRQVWGTGVKWEVIMRMMGLDVVRDTYVGDAQLRGISGGQRKRLTTAEMIVGATNVMMMDEISTGLDSATLYSIISSFHEFCHSFKLGMMISLLQPPPETVAQFDDIIVLTDGLVLFHGPVEEAVPFFESLGFRCPLRKDRASFLQEITTPPGQYTYGTPELLTSKGVDPLHASQPPGNTGPEEDRKLLVPLEEMSETFFNDHPRGQQMINDLKPENRVKKESSHPKALMKKKYSLSWWHQMKEVTARQWVLVLRDKVLLKGRLIQVFVMSLIIGSLYWQIPDDESGVRQVFGSAFLSMVFLSMGNLPQLAITMLLKPTWFKHRDNYFFGASNYSLALTLSQAPVTAMEVLLYGCITYFMFGYTLEVGRFVTYLVILLFNTMSFSSLFRMVAAACPDMVTANTFGGTVLLILLLTSGFTIFKRDIPDYWVWAYWISPMSYGLKAISINELTSSDWDGPAVSGDGTVLAGETQGENALRTYSMPTSQKWRWIGPVYNLGFTLVMVLISGFSYWYASGQSGAMAMVPDEESVRKQRAAALERRESMKQQVGSDPTVGMLEFTPITITLIDLKYFVPNPSLATDPTAPEELQLLKSVTGSIRPGVLTALMGGTGAGKTTLMDVIAMRKTVGRIEGKVLVNGHEQEKSTWSRNMGYAEQFDIHSPQMTVKEALHFSAQLRLPPGLSAEQVLSFVDQMLETVDLMEAMDRMVGLPGDPNGLGMDQRKRLTIGVELVANPSVLFCDEPTSGLDARAAATVMTAVKNVSRQGRTVVVTIHQPSIDIFENFDSMVLLHRGGLVDYIGPLGVESCDLIEYLSSFEGVPPIAPGYNPATWMLEVTGGAASATMQAAQHDFAERYQQHELGQRIRAEALADEENLAKMMPKLPAQGRYATGWLTQVRLMVLKFMKVYWRSPSYNLTRMMMTLVSMIVISTMYRDMGDVPDDNVTTGDIQGVLGVLFMANTFIGMSNLMAVLPIVSAERDVYYRERAASMYHFSVFPWAQQAVEVPYLLVQTSLLVPAMYYIIGFKNGVEEFFYYFVMVFLATAFYTYYGAFLALALPSQGLAIVVAGGTNSLFNIFNGFSISFDDIPAYWKWMNRLNPTTWILYGLAASQLGNSNEMMANGVQTVSEYIDEEFGYEYSFRWVCVAILLAWVAVFRVGGVLALRYINYENR